MTRRPFNPNEVSAGGIVVRAVSSGYEVCLVNDGRYWGIPKGNVERGETPEQAALREISEETGIERSGLRVLAELTPSEYVYRRRDSGRLIFKRVHQYLVSAPPEATLHPQASEIAQATWTPLAEAHASVSFDDTRRALDEARAALAARGLHGSGTA